MPEISLFKSARAGRAAAAVALGVALMIGPPSAYAQDEDSNRAFAPSIAIEPVPGSATEDPAAVPPPPAATVEVAPASADESHATSQVASFAATRLKDSPAVVTVISGEDIRATGARDLIDILNLVPGYFIGLDTQGVVGPGFRGLWGHEGKILLMIDGKEMNELLFSSMQLGNEFPVELIERVEVVRGPGSVIYGGSAELSVINVVTRGLQGASDVMAGVTYGELTGASKVGDGYGRRRVTVSGRYVLDDVPGLSMFASFSTGQGQRSARTFVDNAGAAVPMEGQSALNPTVLQAGVAYRDLQATFLYHHLATNSVTGFGAALDAPVPVNFDAYHGDLVYTLRPTNQFEIVPRFNVSYQRPWTAPSMTDFYYNKSVHRIRGRILGRWAALDTLQITVGGDAIFDGATVLTPLDPNQGLQTEFAGANQISYQTFASYVELFSDNPILTVAAGARFDHHSTVGNSLVPRLVVSRSFGPLSIKGLFSLSFREPGVENLNLGQTNLQPEKTRVFEFEAGVDFFSGQRLSANVFDLRIEEPIAYTAMPGTDSEAYLNLGKQGTRGFELSYRIRGRFARMEANYSFYVPSISENLPPYVVPGHSDQFLAAPAHKGTLRATVRPVEWLSISPTIIAFGEHFTRGDDMMGQSPTAVAIPAQVLANLFIAVDNVGAPGLSLGLGFYNIFGADYRFVRASATPSFADDHAPLPGMDREVLVRLSYAYDPGTAARAAN